VSRIGIPDLLLHKTVPLSAGGTPAEPFRRLLTAILAEKQGLGLFHRYPPLAFDSIPFPYAAVNPYSKMLELSS
jgi:hypothetical protein